MILDLGKVTERTKGEPGGKSEFDNQRLPET
jgi:hypothetical protein